MTPGERERLAATVQANCNIADSRHAADLSLCTYLLLMREFFRWERGIALGATLDRAEVGAWIAARETLWQDCEARPFEPVAIDGEAQPFDPFDTASINERLAPLGLLYGAGLVGAERPVFFLAELAAQDRRDGLAVWTAGHEWARGLLALPAALTAEPRSIVLRRDAIRRACWQRYEAYSLHPHPASAMEALVTHYALADDLDRGLSRWTDDQAEIATLHEVGEARLGARLDPAWSALRLSLTSRRAALGVQAVRDLLADLSLTLPALLDDAAPARLHGWFAHFDGMRKALLPGLEAAYRCWRDGDGGAALRQAIDQGRARIDDVAGMLLAAHAQCGDQADPSVQAVLTTIERGS